MDPQIGEKQMIDIKALAEERMNLNTEIFIASTSNAIGKSPEQLLESEIRIIKAQRRLFSVEASIREYIEGRVDATP